MTEDYNEKFEAMTENMAIEQLYDQLSNKTDVVIQLVRHTAEVYKAAVQAGLPEAIADRLTLKFYDSEMSPVTIYQIEEDEL